MNHILVVDDEAEIRASLEDILREEGYGVATAATAAGSVESSSAVGREVLRSGSREEREERGRSEQSRRRVSAWH